VPQLKRCQETLPEGLKQTAKKLRIVGVPDEARTRTLRDYNSEAKITSVLWLGNLCK
jgi:hypothetical protein